MPETSRVPVALAEATERNLLIPFVGAGMSATVGLPRWSELLARVAESLPSDIAYEALEKMCANDPLRVAEYLFLVAGKEIGPIRHRISQELALVGDPSASSPHVELVNLGARRIYTTNYDDVIERVLAGLGEPYTVVATVRHVAKSDGRTVEIVKYHGDLQWENTLVLTESSYYDRLNFESPLDIKFRSDLLGNSVLFLGYGFGDLNIRIIWHRLMAMMHGVDPEERPRSFIVRLERNPAREALDKAVGITTITLDDDGEPPATRLASFLLELSRSASSGGTIPGSETAMHMSGAFLSIADRVACATTIEEAVVRATPFTTEQLVEQCAWRRIPAILRDDVAKLVEVAEQASGPVAHGIVDALVPNYAAHFPPTTDPAAPEFEGGE